MTPEKLKQLEAELKPCKCGGRLRLVHKSVLNGSFIHFRINCEKCGAWLGGITCKDIKL